MNVNESVGRPRSVLIALVLSAATLAVAAIVVVGLLTTPVAALDQQSRMAVAVWSLIFVALEFALLAALAYRRRWAYYVWLAVLVVTVFFGVLALGRTLAGGSLPAALGVLTLAARLAALVLLLRRSARAWLGVGVRSSSPGEWRADPSGRHQWRYWDGRAWTDHVADEGAAGVDHFEAHVDVPLTSAST